MARASRKTAKTMTTDLAKLLQDTAPALPTAEDSALALAEGLEASHADKAQAIAEDSADKALALAENLEADDAEDADVAVANDTTDADGDDDKLAAKPYVARR